MDTLAKTSGSVASIDSALCDWTSNADIFYQSQEGAISDSNGIIRGALSGGRNISIINGTVVDLRAAGAVAIQFDLALTDLTLKNVSITSAAGIPLEYVTPSGTLDIDTLHLERNGTTAFAENTGGSSFSEAEITDGTWSAVSGIAGDHVTGAPVFKSQDSGDENFMRPTTGSSPLIDAGDAVGPTNDYYNEAFGSPRNIGAVAGDVA